MVSQTLAVPGADTHMRRVQVAHDLVALADLIQVAFGSELERTGNTIVSEMRRMARLGPLLWLFGGSEGLFWPLLDGYVWIENGKLVGNVSLVCQNRLRGVWAISNVAVHPDFRQRGIARKLMEATRAQAVNHGAEWIALEVRADNGAAKELYSELGFETYASTVELSLPAVRWPDSVTAQALPLRARRPSDAGGLLELERAATATARQELEPIPQHRYRMGYEYRLGRWFDRIISGRARTDQVLEEDRHLLALLQVTARDSPAAHRIQVLVHPRIRGTVEHQLIAAALHQLRQPPKLGITSRVCDHKEALQAFLEAGFEITELLDQMRLHLSGREWRIAQ